MGRGAPVGGSGGAPATLDPGAGGQSGGAHPAVGGAPAAAGRRADVSAGPRLIRRLRLDQHVADVVPDPGRAGAGGEVAAGAGDEGPDRVPTPVGRLALAPRGPAGGGKGGESV